LVSKKIKYPSFDEMLSDNDILFSYYNKVAVTGQDLSVGMYYVGIYGYSVTDFTVGVAISRNKSANETKNESETVVS
jgi:hypothetical protein